ncbi:MAG: cyclic pyranopterin monophosphate synthase MoaC [Acidobacteria bacterium]|nr:cyclic pyranopterin monophosphate synthase MoaC [Acidobacteriota bacterium]
MDSDGLTHLDSAGRARMVDVGDKPATRRTAMASGHLRMNPDTRQRVLAGETPKGGVVEVARIAGIQAAKRTSELIPMCHPLPLARVDVEIEAADDGIRVCTTATTTGSTGVEMEALTGTSVALLTLYDMCKALQRDMRIDSVTLESKSGGRSGDWTRDATARGKSG